MRGVLFHNWQYLSMRVAVKTAYTSLRIILVYECNANVVYFDGVQLFNTYGPWGEAWGVSGTLASTLGAMNPLRYRGYVYDAETGLYYLNTRYYNPTWGRFINADEYLSAGENLLSTNVFAYCYCDPINLKYPNGNIAEAALIFTDLSAELIASIAAALGVTVIWVVGIILIVGVAELYSYVVRQANDSSFKDKTLSDVRPHIPDRSKVYQIAYINEQGSLIRLSTYYSYFEALAMLNCLGVL